MELNYHGELAISHRDYIFNGVGGTRLAEEGGGAHDGGGAGGGCGHYRRRHWFPGFLVSRLVVLSSSGGGFLVRAGGWQNCDGGLSLCSSPRGAERKGRVEGVVVIGEEIGRWRFFGFGLDQ